MPIGTGIIYNAGDLILGTVSGSGTAFLETKIAAATSSIVYFDSNARINSASLNSITVGTASYVSGSTSIITNLTASNISSSGTSSFGYVGIGTTSPASKFEVYGGDMSLKMTGLTTGSILFKNSSGTKIQEIRYDDNDGSMTLGGVGGYPIKFITSTTEKMRLSGDGNVGIGTSNPNAKLHIDDASTPYIRITRTGTPTWELRNNYPSTEYGFSINNVTAGTTVLFAGQSGNVGIGTTSPTDKLSVIVSAPATLASTSDGLRITDGTRNVQLSRLGSTYSYAGVAGSGSMLYSYDKLNIVADTSNPIIFNTGGSERVRISGSGTIQLNTLATYASLTYEPSIIYTRAGQSGIGGIYFGNSYNSNNNVGLQLRVSNDGTQIEALTINNAGNVGIGTTSPQFLLDVVSTSTTPKLRIGNAGSNNGAQLILAGSNTTKNWVIANQQNLNGTLEFTQTTATGSSTVDTTPSMVINSSGNVGIGTTTVGNKLTVVTSTQYDGYYLRNSNGVVGTMLGVGTTNDDGTIGLYSSVVLKTNITANGASYFNGGSVGIGTTVPAYKLDVIGPATSNGVTLRLSDAASLANSRHILLTRGSVSGSIGIAGSQTEDPLWLSRSSGYDLIVASSGNIGIGTSIPGALLEISSSTAASLLNVKGVGGNGILFVSGSGNVGIGTTNPGGILDVQSSNAGDQLVRTWNRNTAGTGKAILRVVNSGNNAQGTQLQFTDVDFYVGTIASDRTNGMAFYVGQQATALVSERMRIDINGYVGIGTSNTTPYSSLFSGQLVIDTGTSAVDGIFSSTNNANAAELVLTKKNTTNGFGSLLIQHAGTSGDAIVVNYSVNTSTGAGGTNSFKVTTGGDGYFKGNVGIGTTSPLERITFGSSDSIIARSYATDFNSGYCSRILFNQGGTGYGYLGFYTYQGGTGGGERMRIAENGNVGIGTSSPAYLLDVSGSSRHGYRAADTHQFTGSVSVVGSVTAASFTGSLSGSITSALTASYLTPTNSYTVGSLTSTTQVGGASGTLLSYVTPGIYASGTSTGNAIGIISNTTFANQGAWANIGLHQTGSNVNDINAGVYLSIGGWYQNSGTGLPVYIGGGYTSNSSSILSVVPTNTAGSGNVGIGTTTPAYKLDVNTANDSAIRIRNGAGSANNGLALAVGSGTPWFDITEGAEFRIKGNTYANLGTWNSGNNTKLLINSSGNVGIGTTSPTTKLYVSGSVTALDGRFISNVTSGTDKYFLDCYGTSTNQIFALYENSNTAYLNSYSSMAFRANQNGGSGGYFVFSGANVGIGTTVPTAKLQIGTQTYATAPDATYFVAGNDDFSGPGPVGAISGFPTAANKNQVTASLFDVVGGWEVVNGSHALLRASAYNVIDSTPAFVVLNNGNVGIGTTSPTINGGGLHVYGSGQKGIRISGNSSNSYSVEIGCDATKMSYIQTVGTADRGLQLYTGNASTVVMTLTGSNVGIGMTSPEAKLQTYATNTGSQFLMSAQDGVNSLNFGLGFSVNSQTFATIAGYYTNSAGSGAGDLTFYTKTTSTSLSEKMRIQADGNVGIGTAAPAAKLEISGSSNSALLNIKSPISGAILFVSGSGAVGINTSTVGAYTLQVNGSFAATTKSFVIEHPTKAGKKLIYGSLESPYHGIRLTGRDTLVNGKCKIQLPDYIYKLILHDSVNIQLTGIKCNKTLYVDEINIPENYFTIAYDKAIFESYKDYDFFWDFTGIRTDVPELITEL